MTLLDIILLIILFIFFASGLWFGLIHTLGALLGLVGGIFAARFFYNDLAPVITPYCLGNTFLAQIASFIIIFILLKFLISIIFDIINKFFNILAIIPFLKTINRLAGGIFNLLEGALICGIILFLASRFPIIPLVEKILAESQVAQILIKIGGILAPLLPEAFKLLK